MDATSFRFSEKKLQSMCLYQRPRLDVRMNGWGLFMDIIRLNLVDLVIRFLSILDVNWPQCFNSEPGFKKTGSHVVALLNLLLLN